MNNSGPLIQLRLLRRLLLIMAAVALPYSLFADSRPRYLGFEPAWPKRGLATASQPDLLRNRQDSLRWLIVTIDKDGRKLAVEADTTTDSTLIAHFLQFAEDMKFEPARSNGKKTASKLLLAVRIRPGGLMPLVDWPIDTTGRVTDQSLYEQSLRLNGIVPPNITRFPSYHARVKRRDSVTIYDHIVIRVTLDSAGTPTAIDPVRSTLPGFTQQLVNVCNWAEYAPAMVQGKATAGSMYVLVSLFPELHYPVTARTALHLDSLPRLHQLRIRTILDTTGPLSPPIPRYFSGDSVLINGGVRIPAVAGTGLCLIDSTGHARAGRITTSASFQPRVRKFVSSLTFYPALDWHGAPIPFAGPIEFAFPGSVYARVGFLWLPPDNPRLRQ